MRNAANRLRLVVIPLVLAALALPTAAAGKFSPDRPPTAIARGGVLVEPSVVLLSQSVSVRVKQAFLGLQGRYALGIVAVGSGFVVNPTGTIVTASHVVDPDAATVRTAAVNRFFAQFNLTNRLIDPAGAYRRCVRRVTCDFAITTTVRVYQPIDQAGSRELKQYRARVLERTGFATTDIAVVQVNGRNMPTAPLAQSVDGLQTGARLAALGFPGSAQGLETGVTKPTFVDGTLSALRTQGTGQQLEINVNTEQGMSGGPVINQSGQVVGVVSYHTVRATGETGRRLARSVDDARAALGDAGKRPVRGPADTDFREAMELYWERHYEDAIPEFQNALNLSEGHPLAAEYRRTATERNARGESIALDEGGIPLLAVVGGVAGGLAVLGLLAFFLLRGRRPRPAPAPARAPGGPPRPVPAPVQAQTPPAAPASPAPVSAPPPSPAAAAAGATVVPGAPADTGGKTVVSAPSPTDAPAVVIVGGPATGKRVSITSDLVIGREGADITVPDPEVSRRHALLRRADGHVEVEDLGSQNGTAVNGQKIQGPRRLVDGDVISVGRTTLTVEGAKAARKEKTVTSSPTILIKDGPLAGRIFPIEAEVVLGRERADIVIEDPEVSRRHIALRPTDGGLEVEDLGSANGTYVDGRRLHGSRRLVGGEEIKIGKTAIVVQAPERSSQQTTATSSPA
jgi:pSer/pThr/pTyr-binding forkhead associated (FHA) protein/S1-C subfamily serine protease